MLLVNGKIFVVEDAYSIHWANNKIVAKESWTKSFFMEPWL